MQYFGLLLAVLAFLIIGIWHPLVIKGEYYFGKKKCAVGFALIGLFSLVGSLFLENLLFSAGLAIFGCAALWGILEVYQQEKRVQKGWFPRNPRRTKP